MLLGQPASPPDGKHLGQVKPVYGQQNEQGRQAAKIQNKTRKGLQIMILQGIVEIPVPGIEYH